MCDRHRQRQWTVAWDSSSVCVCVWKRVCFSETALSDIFLHWHTMNMSTNGPNAHNDHIHVYCCNTRTRTHTDTDTPNLSLILSVIPTAPPDFGSSGFPIQPTSPHPPSLHSLSSFCYFPSLSRICLLPWNWVFFFPPMGLWDFFPPSFFFFFALIASLLPPTHISLTD